MKTEMIKGKTWIHTFKGYRRLGKKTEPYYKTEAEMLEDKKYTYETLSPSEKAIYNKTEDETKLNTIKKEQ